MKIQKDDSDLKNKCKKVFCQPLDLTNIGGKELFLPLSLFAVADFHCVRSLARKDKAYEI